MTDATDKTQLRTVLSNRTLLREPPFMDLVRNLGAYGN